MDLSCVSSINLIITFFYKLGVKFFVIRFFFFSTIKSFISPSSSFFLSIYHFLPVSSYPFSTFCVIFLLSVIKSIFIPQISHNSEGSFDMTEVVCKEAVEVPFIDAVKRAKSIRRPDFLLRHQFLFC